MRSSLHLHVSNVCLLIRHWRLNSLLNRGLPVRGHVHHQGSSSTVVKEVDGNARASPTIAARETAVKVREQVDSSSIVGTVVENTGYGDIWEGNAGNGRLRVI